MGQSETLFGLITDNLKLINRKKPKRCIIRPWHLLLKLLKVHAWNVISMVMRQCHHVLQSLTFPSNWHKVLQEKIASLFFSVINLTPSIIDIEFAVFMHTHCAYSTNNPIYLTLFLSFSIIREGQFLLVNITLLFEKRFFTTFVFAF